VPNNCTFSSMKLIRLFSFNNALVCWNRNVLLALPPPLAMNIMSYSLPWTEYVSNCPGRLVLVFNSSNILMGAT